MTPPETKERTLTSYYHVHVPWVDEDGGVNAYFTDRIVVDDHWVRMTAEGWLWSDAPNGPNRTEYFDRPQMMALPRERVAVVYWPDGKYPAGFDPEPRA